MKPVVLSVAGNLENQDRAAAIVGMTGLVLVVADGAGGRSGGTEAAVMAIELVRQGADHLRDSGACLALLRKMDAQITQDPKAGETTCTMTVITNDEVFGASVGDSGALIVRDSGVIDLTRRQARKPFIGSGSAWPIEFTQRRVNGDCVLLATDGLLKYTSEERITEVCRGSEIESVTSRLIELVRYQSGAFPDDVTVVLTRL